MMFQGFEIDRGAKVRGVPGDVGLERGSDRKSEVGRWWYAQARRPALETDTTCFLCLGKPSACLHAVPKKSKPSEHVSSLLGL